jgi:hypothetical protein
MDSCHSILCLFAAEYLTQHFGAHCTGTDGIDSDAVSSVFHGRCFCEAKHSVFARDVVLAAGVATSPPTEAAFTMEPPGP